MRDAAVGRVLVASLQQGITDLLPDRLGFYESWLNAEGLRGGTIGLAPTYAVLSFLRQEGAAYESITARAGEYAADWTVESMPAMTRALIGAMPMWLRGRLVLGVARRLVQASYQGSRAVSSVRKGNARIDVRDSIFCAVCEPVGHPLCGFYAAAFTRLWETFEMPTHAVVVACRGQGESACALALPVTGGEAGVEEAGA